MSHVENQQNLSHTVNGSLHNANIVICQYWLLLVTVVICYYGYCCYMLLLVTVVINFGYCCVSHTANFVLATRTLADRWKQAKIIPVPKVNTPSADKEYRPISSRAFNLFKVLVLIFLKHSVKCSIQLK